MGLEYGVMKAQPRNLLPEKDLLFTPNNKLGIFGPRRYFTNIEDMGKHYWNSEQYKDITFRSATTSESVSALAFGFGKYGFLDYKRDILNECWFQAGRIVTGHDGVYINPFPALRDSEEISGRILRKLKRKSRKVNGIYLGDNDFAFVPYETFEQGQQDARKFAEGGLARGLEHSSEDVAPNLLAMASTYSDPKNFSVNIRSFDQSHELISRVVGLTSEDNLLNIVGSGWDGYAFGIVVEDKIT